MNARDQRRFAKNPTKAVRSVKDLKERPMSEQDRLRRIIHDDGKLINHIILLQNTMRLAKLIPSWEAFKDSEHWFEMGRDINDQLAAKKFRAWWELIFKITNGERRRAHIDKEAIVLAVQTLVLERSRRAYGKTVEIPRAVHIPFEQQQQIKIEALSRYEDLTLEFH
jgi:hypothetical protein